MSDSDSLTNKYTKVTVTIMGELILNNAVFDGTENGNEIEEVSWDVGGIKVFGTLTRPPGVGPFPAVVLVAGGGTIDRNWNSPMLSGTNGSGRLLAQALTEQGFVTLRYDRRDSGAHSGENVASLAGKISLSGHTQELAGAIDLLTSRPDVYPHLIFALTNGEGAISALSYQTQTDNPRLAGLILTGPPGRSLRDTMRRQVVHQLAHQPDDQLLIKHYDRAITQFLADEPLAIDDALPESIHHLLTGLTQPINLPIAREILPLDPVCSMKRISAPLLIVIGKKDIQSNWRVDGKLMTAALAGKENVSFSYPDHADHVLKLEPRPRRGLTPRYVQATYNADGRTLDPDALDSILSWLAGHAATAYRPAIELTPVVSEGSADTYRSADGSLIVIGGEEMHRNWETDCGFLTAAVADEDGVTLIYPDKPRVMLRYDRPTSMVLLADRIPDAVSTNVRLIDSLRPDPLLYWPVHPPLNADFGLAE